MVKAQSRLAGVHPVDDFARCEVELGKYVGPSIVKGLCSNLHQKATGFRPGHAPSEGGNGHH